jgi:transcriptional regulator PpsR
MVGLDPLRNPGRFQAPEALGPVDANLAATIIAASADIALIVDREGVIRDLACSDADISPGAYQSWVGRPWIETVADDSQAKVEQILEDARDAPLVSWREINHRATSTGQDLPIRYSAVRLAEEGRILAIGRDLRAIATLQQQLVSAQQAMEREYARLRHAETRYRLLFQIASEAVLIVDASTHRIVEANPAAGALLGDAPNRLVGRELSKLFASDAWPAVQTLLATVRVAGWAEDVRSRLLADETEALVSASLFRQDSGSLFLIRMSAAQRDGERDPAESRLLEVVHKLPDAFVVIDANRRVLALNAAFLDLVQLAAEQQVLREPIDQWLGRPSVDAGLLVQNAKEHGYVRNFSTVVRGQYGTEEDVEVSGVAAVCDDAPCYGFMIRPVASRFPFEAQSNLELPQSVEQLTGLVGRVPLKDIVRQTTDVIESLCIEAALEVSGDNRASAAQMLGLSRQSLYAKLRRLGVGDGGGEA